MLKSAESSRGDSRSAIPLLRSIRWDTQFAGSYARIIIEVVRGNQLMRPPRYDLPIKIVRTVVDRFARVRRRDSRSLIPYSRYDANEPRSGPGNSERSSFEFSSGLESNRNSNDYEPRFTVPWWTVESAGSKFIKESYRRLMFWIADFQITDFDEWRIIGRIVGKAS